MALAVLSGSGDVTRHSIHEGPEHIQVFQVRARIVVGRFENEGGVREFGMLGRAAKRVAADLAFADVPTIRFPEARQYQ